MSLYTDHHDDRERPRSRDRSGTTFSTHSANLAAFLDVYGQRLIDVVRDGPKSAAFIFKASDELWELIDSFDNDGLVPLKSWRARQHFMLQMLERVCAARFDPRQARPWPTLDGRDGR